MIHTSEIPKFDELSDLDRVALAEEILTSVRDPETLPAPLAHRIELDRRWAAYQADPAIALTPAAFWDQVDAPKP